MTEKKTDTVEVKVGGWDPSGTFLGEILRFEAEEVGSYTELHGQFSNRDDRGTDYTLYRLPDGTYRVLIDTWSKWQGEESYARLVPNDAEDDPYADDPDYGRPSKYTSYTEEEVRSRYPQVFAALGMPNVRDI